MRGSRHGAQRLADGTQRRRMSAIVWIFGEASPSVSVAIGLAGSLIGGAIAGTVSLRVARNARDAAEQAWVRDSRRQIYDRFLTAGQKLLAAMEAVAADSNVTAAVRGAVDDAYSTFFETYASVQTVAEVGTVESARVHAYRLEALKNILDGRPLDRQEFGRIAGLVRFARHDLIDAMRKDLGLEGSARPPTDSDYKQAVEESVRADHSEVP